MKKLRHISIIIALLLVYASCKKEVSTQPEPEVTYTPTPYQLKIPTGFPQPVLPTFNPMTVEGVQLGRMLYYDSILSTNGLKCASCHQPAHSFSSPIYTFQNGDISSVPPHINLAWNPDYNWDGSAPIMDHIPLGDLTPAIFNPNFPLLVQKLKNHPQYPGLFRKAFGVKDLALISYDELKLKISYAIIQFVRTMISYNSKFDKFVRHELPPGAWTSEEMDGYITFFTEKGDCFHCHGTVLLTSNTFNNNGLDTVFTGINRGRYIVTGNPNDLGKFSAPTLRNIELTAPYMHDGRLQTLEDVVEFYNSGVCLNSPNIDPIMTKPAKLTGLHLTTQDKANLIAFLKTFTDTTYLYNADFASPF